MKLLSIILAFSLALLGASDIGASTNFSGRSMGMGGAYTQAARGVESVFWNPANLGFSKSNEKDLMVLSAGFNAYNNALTLNQYNHYNGKFLTSQDKENILESIPSDGLNAAMEASVLGLGISWGNYAFTFSGKGTSDLLLPKDPIEVLFFGNEINDTILFNDSEGEAFASLDFGLSHGRSVWSEGEREILCGITVRYVKGLFYQKVVESRGEIFALETGITGGGDFAVHSSNGGNGYGLDMGITFKYDKNWNFGITFDNLIGSIKWNKNTEEKGYILEIDSLLAEDFDSDSLVVDESYTQTIDPFSTSIPPVVRLGAAYQNERSLLTFDLKGAFKQGMGTYKKLRASFGAEYIVSRLLSLRAGLSLGGNEGITVSNGVGLKAGIYRLDIGMAMQQGLWPTKSKGITLAISNGFRF
jgi:hypothetical protein